ncbi:YdcF family protein [Fulvivirgaceae bacterium BMA12]|uniref:YdcF family protein n=1 Tax=Agaribacillus aureus TaxID=3051825 RepID=A0ABT8L2S1_9BACT|nr:YdcF family protein [Fulvivirgaceae bacterium BMA12]
MFFILSKTIYILAMPLTLVLICFLTGCLLKRRKYKKRTYILGVLLLLLFSNPFIINEIMLKWEIPPKPIADIQGSYQVGIVLTGITNMEKSPFDRVYFNKGADRIMHALQLYKEKKIDKILISGGSGSLFNNDRLEADNLKLVLLQANVPEADIFIENRSRNTFENAQYSAEILNKYFPAGDYLLITSAFHMRRANACFVSAGINTLPYSTDFYTHDRNFHFDTLLFPSVLAIAKWTILFKELLGLTLYKLSGYI